YPNRYGINAFLGGLADRRTVRSARCTKPRARRNDRAELSWRLAPAGEPARARSARTGSKELRMESMMAAFAFVFAAAPTLLGQTPVNTSLGSVQGPHPFNV